MLRSASMSFPKHLRPASMLATALIPRGASLPLSRLNKKLSSTLLSLVQPRPSSSRCQDNTTFTTPSSAFLTLSRASFAAAIATTSPPTVLFTRHVVVRYFSTSPPWDSEYQGRLARRNKNIRLHPEGHGQHILPGNFVIKKHPKTGAERRVFLEHALGYFWAFKDLSLTDRKPILSNESIIPATEAESFPTLKGLVNLHDEVVDIPDFFMRNNRSKDANAQCTLVAISSKEFGARLLPSWINPFENELCSTNDDNFHKQHEVVRITINEGRIDRWLHPFILSGTKKKVKTEDHSKTLLYYGDAEEMRDILRMHNMYTGYVFLVDGIGRLRWAGSGEGSDDEVQSMIKCAKELTTQLPPRAPLQKRLPSPRVGKKLPLD